MNYVEFGLMFSFLRNESMLVEVFSYMTLRILTILVPFTIPVESN